jgi:hypothetical protein
MVHPLAMFTSTVSVLPLSVSVTVPKLPDPKPELLLPSVKLREQLVVDAHRSAEAGALIKSPANRLKTDTAIVRNGVRTLMIVFPGLIEADGSGFHDPGIAIAGPTSQYVVY